MRIVVLIISLLLTGFSSLLACPVISISGSDVNCFLGSNGSASATITGPNAPFSVTWSTGATASVGNGGSTSISGLSAGVYTLYVVDGLGCTSTHVVSIEEPDPVAGVISNTKDVSCFGGNDGMIDLTPLGGNGSYSYSWTNGSTSQDPSSLSAGTHTVTITDGNGCTSNAISAILGEPAAPLTSTIAGEDAKCNGASDGSVDLSPTGGTSPYTFLWSNGAFTEDLSNVPAGTYSVTITDNNGCTATNSITINQPTGITSTLTKTDVSCFEGSDGTVTASVSGGTPTYTYIWANASSTLVSTSMNLPSVAASTYFLTVTDANGCTHTDNIIVNEPSKLEIDTIIVTDVLCHGESTGAIDIEIVGGTPSYTVSWSNSAITEDISSLSTGWYYVNVVDANGCTTNDSAFVDQPLEPLYSYHSFEEPSCYKFTDGQLQLVVEGGTFPYQHTWNRGDTVLTLFDLAAGQYICRTTDKNGCILLDTIDVGEPDSIQILDSIIDVTCFDLSDGIIDITVVGGTADYEFYWDNSTYELSVHDEDLIGYPSDMYKVKVIDSNFCEATRAIFLPEPPLMVGKLLVQDITCFGFDDGIMEAVVTGGNPGGYFYNWSNGETDSIIDSLGPGEYDVTVTDIKGCSVYMFDTIFEPDPIVIDAIIYELTCKDIADAAIEVFPTGGNGGFSYMWWYQGRNTPRIENLPFGEYSITVTDSVGCMKDSSYLVPKSEVPCITPPSAFTPEGDGYNDTWVLENINWYPDAVIQVFNKWGNRVFNSVGYQSEFDGTYLGNKLPAGTYYYRIELIDNAVYTGPVTIVR